MFSQPTNGEGFHGKVSIIGLDLAKRLFQAHGARADGGVAFREKLSREKVFAFFAEQSRWASGPRGFHPRPLPEPGVRLSPHPVPIRPACRLRRAASARTIVGSRARSFQ